jgi:hypothetical protein
MIIGTKNKQNMKQTITIFSITMIFFYLTWSFIIWDFNPSNWTQDARVGFILLAVPLAFLFSAIKGGNK